MPGDLIALTPDLARVYEAYAKHGTITETAKHLGKTMFYVKSRVTILARLGLLEKVTGRPYKLSGMGYKVADYIDIPNLLQDHKKINIQISPKEQEWMEEHYCEYRNNRREAAKILGRHVSEINLMAIALGLDGG